MLKGIWSEELEGVYCSEETGVDRKIMLKEILNNMM